MDLSVEPLLRDLFAAILRRDADFVVVERQDRPHWYLQAVLCDETACAPDDLLLEVVGDACLDPDERLTLAQYRALKDYDWKPPQEGRARNWSRHVSFEEGPRLATSTLAAVFDVTHRAELRVQIEASAEARELGRA